MKCTKTIQKHFHDRSHANLSLEEFERHSFCRLMHSAVFEHVLFDGYSLVVQNINILGKLRMNY